MLATITNLSSSDPLDVPAPFDVTLAASAASTLPCRPRDFHAISDKDRSPADRILALVQEGKMSISFVTEPESVDPEELMLMAAGGQSLQTGAEVFGGGATATITLAKAFADVGDYGILLTAEGADDAPFVDTKTAADFVITFGAGYTGTVYWMAFKL